MENFLLMCGITGIINFDNSPVSPAVLKKMTDILAHRGPDGAGHYCEYNIGLGHRRLSILDLSDAGKQPMINSRNRYVITYNGEIYNFRELRSNLSKLGYLFRSDTDSEVLLEAFNEWGINILNKLNGMFAFAIYDRLEKKLTLARDRYGIKPLYYTVVGNTFLFASEIKAFYKHPKFSKEINLEALVEYFTFQNIFTEQTLHEKVYLLPAGHYTVVDCTKKSLSIEKTQYWDFSFEEPENPAGEDEYIEELDRLFQQAVQRQLVSDVEVGAYLSGGLDSGAISAIASKNIPNLKTFTVGFDLHSASGLELTFDEREKAEYMSYLFQTEHYEMVLKAGDMQRCMKKLIYHLEDPRVGQSYPNFYSSQLASKFVKVVLAGTGGDELFGGYPWRYYRAVINDDFEHYTDKYYKYWQHLIPNSEIWKIFVPIENNVKNVWTRDFFGEGNYVENDNHEIINKVAEHYNPQEYLRKKTVTNVWRSEQSRSLYCSGKICFGLYKKELVDNIILKFCKLFYDFSPDYTSMIPAMLIAKSAIELKDAGIVHVNTNISNGGLCAIDDKFALSFHARSTISIKSIHYLIPGLYVSQHNMVLHDYIYFNNNYSTCIDIDTINWCVAIYEDLISSSRTWSSKKVKDEQFKIYHDHFKSFSTIDKIRFHTIFYKRFFWRSYIKTKAKLIKYAKQNGLLDKFFRIIKKRKKSLY